MSKEPERLKMSRWFRWSIFSASWFLFFIILLIYSANNGLNELCHTPTGNNSALEPLKNEIRGLRLTRYDPAYDSRPIYSIHFESLRSENNHLGFFKTGLYKIVKIQDLSFELYRYSQNKTCPKPAQAQPRTASEAGNSSKFDMRDVFVGYNDSPRSEVTSIINKMLHPTEGWRVEIDLSHVSEVSIDNLNFKLFHDRTLLFSVQSKNAFASYKQPGLALRGHVIITAADGSRLDCNYATWDFEKQYFHIKGVYVLNRGSIVTSGKGICIDSQLNPVRFRQAKSKQKEKKECFAKL